MGMAAPIYYTAEMVQALPDDGNRFGATVRHTIILVAAAAGIPASAAPARAQVGDTTRIDSALARHVRTARAPSYFRLYHVRPLAGGRFYTLVARSATEDSPYAVLLCQGTVHAESTAVACLALQTSGRPAGLSDDDGTQFTVTDGDFDRDGEPELNVFLGYGRQSYTGAMEHNQFYVVDLVPGLRAAASAYIFLRNGIGYEPELTFEDFNGDGHPDIEVRAQACQQPREEGALVGCQPIVRRLLWNARTSSWAAAGGAARR